MSFGFPSLKFLTVSKFLIVFNIAWNFLQAEIVCIVKKGLLLKSFVRLVPYISNSFVCFKKFSHVHSQRASNFQICFYWNIHLAYVAEVSYWDPIDVFALKFSCKFCNRLCQIWICYISSCVTSINSSVEIRAIKDKFFFAVEGTVFNFLQLFLANVLASHQKFFLDLLL